VGASPLDHVLRHNTWATGALIEFCRALDSTTPEMAATGTYGTLGGTLQHLVGAEQWYVKLLTGEVIGRPIRRTDAPHSLDELATIAASTGERLIAMAASDDPARIILTNEPRRSTVGSCSMQQREDVEHAKENLAAAQEELDALNAELEEKIARIRVK
jgi:uncharacterized damage-inducible protein DinB